MENKVRYLLAVESAVAGGSIALFKNDDLIGAQSSDESVSRAEDLFPNIVSMLSEAGVEKYHLSRIAVSLGPGSYTGLRIGIASVMGLSLGLGADYIGIPLFQSLAAGVSNTLIALPMGKTDICFAESRSPEESRVVNTDTFIEIIRDTGSERILVHPAAADIVDRLNLNLTIDLLDPNLAIYVGRAALTRLPSEALDPIYVQNPRFG